MIGWVRGRLIAKRPPSLLLDVGGVGYELEAPMTTFYALPEIGQEVTLYAHQVVREDAHHLYGFAREAERDVFRQLLRISGVGAKLALAILSGMDATGLARCVFAGDAASLARLPGIGKKTADRLVLELRHRLAEPAPAGNSALPGASVAPAGDDPVREAVSALVALGLKPHEASRHVQAIDCEGLACEEIVRRALQALVR